MSSPRMSALSKSSSAVYRNALSVKTRSANPFTGDAERLVELRLSAEDVPLLTCDFVCSEDASACVYDG